MFNNLHGFLVRNFRGCSVINRKSCYEKIAEVTPFSTIKHKEIDENVDVINVSLGNVSYIFKFIWGKSCNGFKQRITDIEPIEERYNLTKQFQKEQPDSTDKPCVVRHPDGVIIICLYDGKGNWSEVNTGDVKPCNGLDEWVYTEDIGFSQKC